MKPVAQGMECAELETELPCPDCGRGLLVGSMRDAVTLLCLCGLQVNVDEIAASESRIIALEAVLRDWDTQLNALRALSVHARLDGFEAISELYSHRIGRLEAQIELLRKAVRS